MNLQPRLRTPMKPTDWVLETLGWLLLLFLVVLVGYYYDKLPDTVPTHFGFDGQPDEYGPKRILLLLPAVGAILFVGMAILNRFPHLFNYPVTITPDNAALHYARAQRLMRLLGCVLMGVFIALSWVTIQVARKQAEGFPSWFVPAILVVVLLPIGVFFWQSFQDNNK